MKTLSREEFLFRPLPTVDFSGAVDSDKDQDSGTRKSHPTEVEDMPDWESKIKGELAILCEVSLLLGTA